MNRNLGYRSVVLGLAIVAFPVWVSAQETSTSDASQSAAEYVLPEKFDDPAFRQYVDITLLEPAWKSKDAELMIDLALQLAEGERVLMRPHKAGSSRDLLKLSSAVASRKSDVKTIARIEKAAKALKLDDVAVGASKLAGTSRKAAPGAMVSLEQANLDEIAEYGSLLDSVHSAEILRDKSTLDEIEKSLDQNKSLSDAQKTYIVKTISDVRSSISDAGKDDTSQNSIATTISKLEGESRGWGPGGIYGTPEAQQPGGRRPVRPSRMPGTTYFPPSDWGRNRPGRVYVPYLPYADSRWQYPRGGYRPGPVWGQPGGGYNPNDGWGRYPGGRDREYGQSGTWGGGQASSGWGQTSGGWGGYGGTPQ